MMMEKIKKSEFENTEISINEDNYIINHNDNYFKMGLAEGQLFEALYSGKDFDYILNTYNITEEDLSRFIEILRKNNIIGAPRKRKKNIVPSLTVVKRKNRCIHCVCWIIAIFCVVTVFSIFYFPLLSF